MRANHLREANLAFFGDLFADPPGPGCAPAEPAGYAPLGRPVETPPRETERFCAWRGHSGRRYVTSIYSFADCPDYEHAVALAVRRAPDGARVALAGIDLGACPAAALNGPAMRAAREQGATEVHLHLLAGSPEARAAAIEDIL